MRLSACKAPKKRKSYSTRATVAILLRAAVKATAAATAAAVAADSVGVAGDKTTIRTGDSDSGGRNGGPLGSCV